MTQNTARLKNGLEMRPRQHNRAQRGLKEARRPGESANGQRVGRSARAGAKIRFEEETRTNKRDTKDTDGRICR